MKKVILPVYLIVELAATYQVLMIPFVLSKALDVVDEITVVRSLSAVADYL